MLQAFILLTFLFGVSTIVVLLINYRLKILLKNKSEELEKQLDHVDHLHDSLKMHENKLGTMIQMDKVNQEALKQKSELIQELEKLVDSYKQEESKLKEIKPKVRKPHRKPRSSK